MANEHGPTLRNRMAVWSPPQISVNALKITGAVLTALYFFSAAVVQNGMLHVSGLTTDELNGLLASDKQAMLWAGIGSAGSVIGVTGIPTFSHLLVQGAEHTASFRRYILSVLLFAVISEIPYDLAMTGQLWNWSEQNSLWTALISLIYATAPLGFVPVALCGGRRRDMGQWGKYAYYVFYPVMLALFALWGQLLSLTH